MCEHHNKEYYSFRRICAEGDVFLLAFATFYKHMGAFSLVPNMCMNDCLGSLQHYTLLSMCTTQFYFKLLQKKKKKEEEEEEAYPLQNTKYNDEQCEDCSTP